MRASTPPGQNRKVGQHRPSGGVFNKQDVGRKYSTSGNVEHSSTSSSWKSRTAAEVERSQNSAERQKMEMEVDRQTLGSVDKAEDTNERTPSAGVVGVGMDSLLVADSRQGVNPITAEITKAVGTVGKVALVEHEGGVSVGHVDTDDVLGKSVGEGTTGVDQQQGGRSDAVALARDFEVQSVCSGVEATGGGAYRFVDLIKEKLGVSIEKEEEMECLVAGANFLLKVGY
ncbi:hypothetical protein LWI29_007247 [Acer saccharum]|uniref:Uncharacterized protein n=1 Tax=Acer saccharum TaxID=4024 RepID=A0AA39T0C9_ACESA|nr:hypothetical protein LWI29_007247 [Acer saccharum]